MTPRDGVCSTGATAKTSSSESLLNSSSREKCSWTASLNIVRSRWRSCSGRELTRDRDRVALHGAGGGSDKDRDLEFPHSLSGDPDGACCHDVIDTRLSNRPFENGGCPADSRLPEEPESSSDRGDRTGRHGSTARELTHVQSTGPFGDSRATRLGRRKKSHVNAENV